MLDFIYQFANTRQRNGGALKTSAKPERATKTKNKKSKRNAKRRKGEKMYNYLENVTEDAKIAILENYTEEEIKENLESSYNRQQFEQKLYDELWTNDSVTGNGSGSYTFNTYKAEENLAHNFDLLEEIAQEFGIEPTIRTGWEHGAEWWDSSIRCYLLPQAISQALNEIEEELEEGGNND